jgi:hypothetical protein
MGVTPRASFAAVDLGADSGRMAGTKAPGMSDDEIRAVCAFHQVSQAIV